MLTVLDKTVEELTTAVVDAGWPRYRAQQIADWVYRKWVTDPAAMKNLPAAVREQLQVVDSRSVAESNSADGTTKLLIELADGQQVECVSIPAGKRVTACLSTQVGCGIRCGFCAACSLPPDSTWSWSPRRLRCVRV